MASNITPIQLNVFVCLFFLVQSQAFNFIYNVELLVLHITQGPGLERVEYDIRVREGKTT